MPELSIVVLNRLRDDPMSKVQSSLPPMENLELIYVTPIVTPIQTDRVNVVRVNSNTLRIEYPSTPGGIETDRILGAVHASGAHILFMDTHRQLLPYEITNMHTPLKNGASIVLRSKYPRDPEMSDTVALASTALNLILDRPELGAASLTRFPHGINRDVFHTVPREELWNPPRFLAKCVLNRLRVETFYREEDSGPIWNESTLNHILADHLEALREITDQKGPRAGYTDMQRRRNAKVGFA